MTFIARWHKAELTKVAAGAVVALVLAGCDVGDGTRPVSMTLLDGSTGAEEISLFQCFEGSVAAIVEFSNGQAANFLQPDGFPRPVELTSSDESVVRVSNGTLEVPLLDGQVYFRGALIPVGPGPATITAKFSDFEETIDVTVKPPDSVVVRPETQTVAVGGFQSYEAAAIFDGAEVSISQSVLWSLMDASGDDVDPEIAEIANTGLLAGRDVGGPFTVKASLTGCATPDLFPPTVDAEDLLAVVNVKEAADISLERRLDQLDDEGDQLPMVVGTTDAFAVFASFADPADGRHDVSAQAVFAIDEPGLDEDEASVKAIFGAAGVRSILLALAATEPGSPLSIQATFGPAATEEEEEPELLTSNSLQVEIVEGTLQAIHLSPVDAVIPQFETLDYTIDGDYLLADESILTLDIRRQAALTSSDTTVVQLNSTANNPARVRAVTDEPGCSRIRAEIGSGDSLLFDETLLYVVDDTVACEPPEDDETP